MVRQCASATASVAAIVAPILHGAIRIRWLSHQVIGGLGSSHLACTPLDTAGLRAVTCFSAAFVAALVALAMRGTHQIHGFPPSSMGSPGDVALVALTLRNVPQIHGLPTTR